MILTAIVCVLIVLAVLLYAVDYIRRRPRVPGLAKKAILITGCDHGFGNLLARRLDEIGCPVIAACLTEKGAMDIKAVTSERLKTVQMDVADSASVKKAYDQVKQMLEDAEGLWGLVNNAGVGGGSGPSEFHTREDYLRCLQVNVLGVVDVTNTFLPLVKSARGRVVNMSSISGRVALSCITMYSVSKWAVEAYSDCLRRTLEPFGVQVSIIEPGAYGTPITGDQAMGGQHWWKLWSSLPKHIQEDYGEAYIEKCIENGTRFARSVNPNISEVVDTIQDALFSVRPRTRYAVGPMARYLTIPASYAPSWFQDWMQIRHAPIPKRHLGRNTGTE